MSRRGRRRAPQGACGFRCGGTGCAERAFVHEHFVNYESNDPKRFLKHIDPDFAVYWSRDETGNVEVSVTGYKLNVGAAAKAADAMASAALEALSV